MLRMQFFILKYNTFVFFYLIIIRIKYSKYKNLQYIILNSNGIIRII